MIRRRLFQIVSTIGLVALSLALLTALRWSGSPDGWSPETLRYLALSGVISLGFGFAGIVWLRQGIGPLWFQMTLIYTLGVAIALFNIFLTLQLMLISSSDVPLLILLLIFAGAISLVLGVNLALAISSRVTAVNRSAQALAQGDLAARVVPQGRDELTALAREFNRMAEQLASSAAERDRQEAARRDLIAAVSHDLRTPLASLNAVTEAIADGMIDDREALQRHLGGMRTQIKHLNSLITDLFELSQLDAGAMALELEYVSFRDIVSDTINGMHAHAAAKQIALQAEVTPDVGAITIAPFKIERVLGNLIMNAIRHTAERGWVHIRACHHDEATQRWLLVEIADNGEGISAEDLPHVFDRFYRAEKSRSRSTGGTGLGLAISRGIVEAHGGQIWIESQHGAGTTVRFTLPYQEGMPAARSV